jgi:hypothetical protein
MSSCAPIRADHRDDRGAEAERQRLQDVFQTCSDCVTDCRFASQLTGYTRKRYDGQVGDCRVYQAGHADLEDIGKQLPPQHGAAKG